MTTPDLAVVEAGALAAAAAAMAHEAAAMLDQAERSKGARCPHCGTNAAQLLTG